VLDQVIPIVAQAIPLPVVPALAQEIPPSTGSSESVPVQEKPVLAQAIPLQKIRLLKIR